MDRELIWLITPIWSFLHAFGGWRNKNWRRLGIPLTLLASGLFFPTPWLPLVCSSLLLALCLRLPFTLIGNSVNSSAWNWVWIFVLPLLQSSPSLVLRIEPLAVVVPALVLGLLGTLSNVSLSSRFVPWKWYEACAGFLIAYPYCLALY